MKRITILSILLLSLTLSYTSCVKDYICISGEGEIMSTTLNIDSFIGINSMGAEKVTITQGGVQKVEVLSQENIVAHLQTEVIGGIWKIKLDDGLCFTDYDLSINITTPNIEEVSITGSADIHINDFYNQDQLSINITGSGDIELHDFKDCTDLSIDILGSGNIDCLGQFDDLENINLDIGGSGDFYGFNAETNNCDIDITGSGMCKVSVKDHLDVKISGSGDIYYKGNPFQNTNITGTGRLIDSN